MIDMLQAFAARRLIHAHGKTWLQCYLVPGDGPRVALAVECTEDGKVVMPAVVQLVQVEAQAPP